MQPCRKKRHATKEGAIIAQKRMKNSGLNAYYCASCRAWHLGSSRSDYRKVQRINELLDRILAPP